MALYDYVCPDCGHRETDVSVLIAECDTHVELCTECSAGSRMERRTQFSTITTMGPLLAHSENPNVQRFLETGDPAGLKRTDPLHIA